MTPLVEEDAVSDDITLVALLICDLGLAALCAEVVLREWLPRLR